MRQYFIIQSYGVDIVYYEKNNVRISFGTDDPANTDCQQYLAWLAEGNSPEPWNPESAPVDEAQPSTDAG